MTKSRPGIPGAPKCINLIRNLQLNTSTMVKKNCSWILRPPTAERKCTGHKRSQSKHTGEFHQIYLSHTITHQKRPKNLNPNTQVTTNCKNIYNTRQRNPNPNTIAIIEKCHLCRVVQTNSCFAGSSLCNICPLPSSPHPLRDLQELDARHLWVCREEGLCGIASVSVHCSRT